MSFDDSLWHSTAGDSFEPRPPLPGDIDVDVAIVGAGYTGLWTAYYLHSIDPSMRIAIVEREIAGFGASGRNGGWCSALFPPASSGIARRHGADAAVAMRRAMHESIVEVGRVAEAEGLDIHYARGGTIQLARNPAQLARAREIVEDERSVTGDVEGLELLSKEQAEDHARGTRVLGGTYTPHCAAIHPLRLVRGLASLRGGARRLSLRAHHRDRDQAGRAAHRSRHGACRDRGARDRGLHTQPARPAAQGDSPLLADDRHRAAVGGGLGSDRAAPPPDLRGPSPHAHLRPAHGRRPPRVRRPRRAVPLRLSHEAVLRPQQARALGAAGGARGPVPGGRRLRGHARVGRRARDTRAIGTHRRGWTGSADSPGRAATWATACPPPISRAARWRS